MDAETFWMTIVLGIVQGIAEFLPISSSGHLVIVGALFKAAGWGDSLNQADEDLAMNVALHAGTLISIIWVYWHACWRSIARPSVVASIVIATLPVVVIGLAFKDQIEAVFSSPLWAGCGLLVTAALLFSTTLIKPSDAVPAPLPWWKALIVGCFQAVAILPGISRSGSTITAGLLQRVPREQAAEFSFLIAIPAISGATLLKLKDLLEASSIPGAEPIAWAQLGLGLVTSCVVGIISLLWLIRWIRRGKLHYFAPYCLCLGLAVIAWQLSLATAATPLAQPATAQGVAASQPN